MDENLQTDILQPRVSARKRAVQDAAERLRAKDHLVVLTLAYLFCVTSLFALLFAVAILDYFWVPVTAFAQTVCVVAKCAFATALFLGVMLPLFAGRLRMAGLCAAGKRVTTAELFHYFGSVGVWWRGVRIASLCLLGLVLPVLFSVPALAIGNESLSLRRVFVLSVGRVSLVDVLGFWGRTLVRFVLGLLTLGLLWLLYDAHHIPVVYFSLAMQEQTE